MAFRLILATDTYGNEIANEADPFILFSSSQRAASRSGCSLYLSNSRHSHLATTLIRRKIGIHNRIPLSLGR